MLNADQLAQQLGISRRQIFNLIDKPGELPPYVRVGHQLRWNESSVLAWLKYREAQSRAKLAERAKAQKQAKVKARKRLSRVVYGAEEVTPGVDAGGPPMF